MKFVIDWLNGRANGLHDADRQRARSSATSWSTGKVGMIGTSYEGTLPLAAATTGVEGLEVVIPVSPNTSLLPLLPLQRAGALAGRLPGRGRGRAVRLRRERRHREPRELRPHLEAAASSRRRTARTGDYNEFWAARDLLPHVANIRAAVLLAHGLNDCNVMPSHSVRIYEEMKARGMPVSMYLHQGGHGGDPPARHAEPLVHALPVRRGQRRAEAIRRCGSSRAPPPIRRTRARGARASASGSTMPAAVPAGVLPRCRRRDGDAAPDARRQRASPASRPRPTAAWKRSPTTPRSSGSALASDDSLVASPALRDRDAARLAAHLGHACA